jgi:hypothetical protein
MGTRANSCSPPSNLLLWFTIVWSLLTLSCHMVFYSHFPIWDLHHGLLFHLNFSLCCFSWSFFLDIKHEVFNRCSSWYSIPFKALIVMFFMIICSCYLAQGHWCLLWSPLEVLITILFMDFYSYSRTWGPCTNTSWSFIFVF